MEANPDKAPLSILDELRGILFDVELAGSLDELRPLFYRADKLIKQYPADPDVQSQGAQIKQRIAARGSQLKQQSTQQQASVQPSAPAARTPSGPFPVPPGTPEPPQRTPSGPFPAQPAPPAARTPSGPFPVPPGTPEPPQRTPSGPFPAQPAPPAARTPSGPFPVPPGAPEPSLPQTFPAPATGSPAAGIPTTGPGSAPPESPFPWGSAPGGQAAPPSPFRIPEQPPWKESTPQQGFPTMASGSLGQPPAPAGIPPAAPPQPPSPPPAESKMPSSFSATGGAPLPTGGFGGAVSPHAGTPPQPPSPGTIQGPAIGGRPRTRTGPRQPARPPQPAKGKKFPILQVLGAGLLGVLIVVVILWKFTGVTQKSTLIPIEFQTNPPGASVRVDRDLRGNSNLIVDLEPGEHRVEVILDGYEPLVTTVAVSENAPRLVSLTLQPRPQTVRIYADLLAGSAQLDGQPAGDLKEGQLVLEQVPPGPHNLVISGGGSEASFSFELAPGRAPLLTSPIQAKNALAVVISNSGKQAIARSSRIPMKVFMNGQQAGEIGLEGLTITDIYPGDHELRLGEGNDARKLVVSFGPNPTLTAFLKLDLNAGSLLVVTGVDDVTLTLNGKEYHRKTREGQLRIPLLAVKDHVVSVYKEGYEKPAEQVVAIRKGEESRVEFLMKPIPQMAQLRTRGLPSGTAVFLDQRNLGTVQPDGSFSTTVQPGEHSIEFRRDRYKPFRLSRQFRANQTVEIGPDDVRMEKSPGTVRLVLSPPDSTITYRVAGENRDFALRENPVSLPEGAYTFKAIAPGYSEKQATVQVTGGDTITVDLKLARESVVRQAVKLGMEGWEQPDAWKAEGSWQARQGGNYVLFRPVSGGGVFVFTAAALKGGEVRWVVNYKDPRNHILMEIDKNNFYRREVVNGKTRELAKARHGLKQNNYFTLTVDISPGLLVHKIFRDGGWQILDTWTLPGTDFAAGRFGFYIRGNDKVGLSNFSFTGR